MYCPKCCAKARYALAELPPEHVCACGEKVKIDPEIKTKTMVDRCAVCGLAYFYVDKNFNKRFGCVIMLLAAIAFLVVGAEHWWAALILVGTAAVDFLLYRLVSWYAICYKCLTEYRGFQRNPEHKTYELAVAQHFADQGPNKA